MLIKTDKALVRAARRGNQEAFRMLFDRYHGRVVRYCRSFTKGDLPTAEDLAQDTFVKCFSSLDKLADARRVAPYLLTIAANTCYNHLRSTKRYDAALERYTVMRFEEGEDDDPLLRELKIELVARLIQDMDEGKEKTIVTSYYTDFNLTTRAIAARMGIPHGTVTVTLKRARAKLQTKLARELGRLEQAMGGAA